MKLEGMKKMNVMRNIAHSVTHCLCDTKVKDIICLYYVIKSQCIYAKSSAARAASKIESNENGKNSCPVPP